MFKEHQFTIWGTYCKCGNECSILQNGHHPWVDKDFVVKLSCSACNNEVVIDSKRAREFYNDKIYSYFDDVYGTVVDLGCGSGFLSRHLLQCDKVHKIYGLDMDSSCQNDLKDITGPDSKFEFVCSDIDGVDKIFKNKSIDFLVSRDVFMYIEDTAKYFDNVNNIVCKGIKQMGWYMKNHKNKRNDLLPEQIAMEYETRGWKVELQYLNWYKSGYFINAYR